LTAPVPELIVIFRTHSDVEASIVRGLLEANGVPSVITSDVPHNIFPLMVNGLGEVRISVRQDDADDARRIIDAHRTELQSGQLVRLRDEFETLQAAAGYRFRDRGLLEHAMTHTSRANEDASGGVMDNESLEFLGDAVLGFVMADMLFHRFPTHSEGYKSKVKASIVSAVSLTRLAEQIELGRYVILGKGEEKTGGRRKHAILADGFEAVIAAIYLDGGIEAAQAFIISRFEPLIIAAGDQVAEASFTEDWKSALQEFMQASGRGLPVYRLASAEGPDHRKRFDVEVLVTGTAYGRATGRSKKEAEQQAAREALGKLKAGGSVDLDNA